MREITTKVYSYAELNDKAKEKAKEWYRGQENFEWLYAEVRDTFEAAQKHFSFKVSNWQYDMYSVNVGRIEHEHELYNDENEIITVQEWVNARLPVKDCPFTGVCYDENFLDVFRNSANKYETLTELFHDAVYSLFKSASKEMEYLISDAAIEETMTANEYEFTENGKFI